MPRIGEMDQMIQVQARQAGQDELGQASGAWSTVATMWAKAEPLSGREYFAAGQMQSLVSVKFTVRYRTTITELHRVVWRDQPYAIVAPPIDVGGQRLWLELMCTQGAKDG